MCNTQVGRPSLVVPLMPIQVATGAVDCGLGDAEAAWRTPLEECLAAAAYSTDRVLEPRYGPSDFRVSEDVNHDREGV